MDQNANQGKDIFSAIVSFVGFLGAAIAANCALYFGLTKNATATVISTAVAALFAAGVAFLLKFKDAGFIKGKGTIAAGIVGVVFIISGVVQYFALANAGVSICQPTTEPPTEEITIEPPSITDSPETTTEPIATTTELLTSTSTSSTTTTRPPTTTSKSLTTTTTRPLTITTKPSTTTTKPPTITKKPLTTTIKPTTSPFDAGNYGKINSNGYTFPYFEQKNGSTDDWNFSFKLSQAESRPVTGLLILIRYPWTTDYQTLVESYQGQVFFQIVPGDYEIIITTRDASPQGYYWDLQTLHISGERTPHTLMVFNKGSGY